MKYEWVIGKYEGTGASKVTELANAGVGYHLLEESGRGGAKEAIVIFRRPIDGPTPPHLEVLEDSYKIQKYERLSCLRKGLHQSTEAEKCTKCGY